MGIEYLKASFKMDDVTSRVANWFCPLRVKLEFVFKELSFGSGKCYFGISSWLRRYKAIHDNIIIMLDKNVQQTICSMGVPRRERFRIVKEGILGEKEF